MKLNSIPKSGQWNGISDRLNENFSKINVEVESLGEATIKNCGYFSTLEALQHAYPIAGAGSKAYVGASYPYAIYLWNTASSAWVDSGETGGEENVKLEDYYTKSETDEKLTELESEVGRNHEDTNKTYRENGRIKDVLLVQPKDSINKVNWVSNQGKLLTDVITNINSKNGVFIPFGDNAVFDEEQYTSVLWADGNPIEKATLAWYFSDINKEYVGDTAQHRGTLPYQPSARGIVIFSPNETRYEEIKGLRITHIELIPTSLYNTVGTTVQYPFIDAYDSKRLDDIEDSIENAKNEIENVVEINNDVTKKVEDIDEVLRITNVDNINKVDSRFLKGGKVSDFWGYSFSEALFLPIVGRLNNEKKYTLNVYLDGEPADSLGIWRYCDENKASISSTIYFRSPGDDDSIPPLNAAYIAIYSQNESVFNDTKDKTITFVNLIESDVFRQDEDKEYEYSDKKVSQTIEELRSEIADNAYTTRGKVYGIAYDNKTGKVSRVADAVGKQNKYLVGSDFIGERNDFDHIFPWCEMKMCNINDGVITYQGEDGFTLDGSNGDVMVEIPKFYSYRKVENDIDTICISGEKKSGFHLEPIFYDSESGGELDYAYVGRYKANFDEDGLHSKSGIAPTCSISYNTLRGKASGNIIDFSTMLALQKLMSIEFAAVDFSRIMGGLSFIPYHGRISAYEDVTNSNTLLVKGVMGYNGADEDASPVECMWEGMQFAFADWVENGTPDYTPLNNRRITAIGEVYTDGKYKVRSVTFDGAPITTEANKKHLYSTPQKSGLTDTLLYHTGRCGLGKWAYGDQFHYRYIEGFIGNCGEIMDGCVDKNLELYFTNDLKKYGNTEEYTKLSYKLPLQEDYATVVVTKMGCDRKNPLINCPVAYTEDPRQESFYGDPVFTRNDGLEHVAYWGMQLDAGCGNGLFTERFWFEKTDTSPLYGTRKIIRENF